MLSGHVKRLREKSAILDDLKASLNDIVKKVEENFDEDPTNYKNAKWAFTKTVKSFLGKKIEPYIQPIKQGEKSIINLTLFPTFNFPNGSEK